MNEGQTPQSTIDLLDGVAKTPAWHDWPTCTGMWVTVLQSGDIVNFPCVARWTQAELDHGRQVYGEGHYFGPISEYAPEKEESK